VAAARGLRVTVHDKCRGTVELRVFVPRAGGTDWHRAGTLCVAWDVWRRLGRPLLQAGALAARVPLTVDESRAGWQDAAPFATRGRPRA
jgi:hypothetical protein